MIYKFAYYILYIFSGMMIMDTKNTIYIDYKEIIKYTCIPVKVKFVIR